MFRELHPHETYAALSEDETAVLIDCRSAAEWHFTGIPDLAVTAKRPASSDAFSIKLNKVAWRSIFI